MEARWRDGGEMREMMEARWRDREMMEARWRDGRDERDDGG